MPDSLAVLADLTGLARLIDRRPITFSRSRRRPPINARLAGQVQQAIVVLMDNTLKELRGSAPSLDSAELTVESCIFHSFDR